MRFDGAPSHDPFPSHAPRPNGWIPSQMTDPHAYSLPSDLRGVLTTYWRAAKVRPPELVIPLALTVLTTFFEGLCFALLIPIANAVSEGGFTFLESSRAFGWILSLAPAAWQPGQGNDSWILLFILLLIVASRFAFLGADYLRKVYVTARNERYRAAVIGATFGQILTFGRGYFQNRSAGEIDTELRWSASAPDLLDHAENLFQRGIRLLVKVGIMLAISVPLSIAFLLTFPPILWIMRQLWVRLERIAHTSADLERETRRDALDLLGTIPLVKAVSREDEAVRHHTAILDRAVGVAVHRQRIGALSSPLTEVAILGTLLAVQGTIIAISGEFRPGDLGMFAAFLLLAQQSFPDLQAVTGLRVHLAEAFIRLQAVARLFQDGGKYVVPSGTRSFAGLRNEIRVDGLSFAYSASRETVLDRVQARLPAGQMTAIVGETGSGKTTFVDLLARFYDCPPGTILLDGVDVRDFDLGTLHARMAVVSQETWLLNRSLRRNLNFGLERTPPDEALLDLLEDVALGDFVSGLPDGLDTEIGDRGIRLSGGQRQRISIARALLRDPEILILDEATSALDSVVEAQVLRSIERRSANRTLIVIAHRLSTLRGADHILVMGGGQIVEAGAWDDLLAKGGHFTRLHTAQFGHGRTAAPPTRTAARR